MLQGFDVISDLHLIPNEEFNWEGKATSLYCIIAGNISHDIPTIIKTLSILSRYYQGVFYALGALEYQDVDVSDVYVKTKQLLHACSRIKNVAVLHQNVVIIDGVAYTVQGIILPQTSIRTWHGLVFISVRSQRYVLPCTSWIIGIV